MSKSFTDLFYGKGRTAFYKAVGRREVYEARRLVQKLREALFLETLEAEVEPSFHFGIWVEQTLTNIPTSIDVEFTFQSEGEKFVASEVNYLRARLQEVLICFQTFPQLFIDLYRFYPRFNLRFEEIEFVYLDFGSQTPKVIDSLLKELLVRDQPLREPLAPLGGAPVKEVVLPPGQEAALSYEDCKGLMRSYFVKHARYPVFVEIISLYLKARPQIREECINGLLILKIHPEEVTEAQLDDALAQFFIMHYLFNGVSSEALRFCAANAHFYVYPGKEEFFQDPFKKERDLAIIEGNSYTEVERQDIIKRRKKVLEDVRQQVAKAAAMTHDEKLAEKKARDAAFEKKIPAYEALFAAAKRGKSSETE